MEQGHPLCKLLFFISVLIITLAFLHPFILLFSLSGAILWRICQRGLGQALRNLALLLPLGLLAALINPLFNHRGVHILFYLPSGNPFTEESLIYGLCAALMIMSVLLYSLCFKDCFGTDSLNELMGKRLPRLALLFSLIFGFIPRLYEGLKSIDEAKRGLGESVGRSLGERLRYGARLFSSLLDRELDRCFDYVAALKAGGYAISERSRYPFWRFKRRDALMLGLILALLLLLLSCAALIKPSFFPILRLPRVGVAAVIGCLLFFIPAIYRVYEVIKWKCLNVRG